MAANALRTLLLFPVRTVYKSVFLKTQHIISNLKTIFQSQNEDIYTKNITKVLNNFVFCLHKHCDLKRTIFETSFSATNKYYKCVERYLKVSHFCVQ